MSVVPSFPMFCLGQASVGSHSAVHRVSASPIRLTTVKLLDGTMHPLYPLTVPSSGFFVQLLRMKQNFLVGTKDQNLHLESAKSVHFLSGNDKNKMN